MDLAENGSFLGVRLEMNAAVGEPLAKGNPAHALTAPLRFPHRGAGSRGNQTSFEFADRVENPARERGRRIVGVIARDDEGRPRVAMRGARGADGPAALTVALRENAAASRSEGAQDAVKGMCVSSGDAGSGVRSTT
jgi:hypothetical protein